MPPIEQVDGRFPCVLESRPVTVSGTAHQPSGEMPLRAGPAADHSKHPAALDKKNVPPAQQMALHKSVEWRKGGPTKK